MQRVRVAACSEFPNDNPALHDGSIWVSTTIGGEVECEPPQRQRSPEPPEEWHDGEPIEIVDDLGFEDVAPEGIEPVAPSGEPAPPADAFRRLVGLVKEVAAAFGADSAAVDRLDAVLGLASPGGEPPPQAIAWRGILRGESEDYEACGAATLDEWAADVVAGAVGAGVRAEGIRRELRKRGVAAFGLVEDVG